jgi:sensor domain CHASE-containing protein/HAMP domain-containing protein
VKIQFRFLLLLGLVFLASTATLAGVLYAVVLPAFAQIDNDQAAKNVTRIEQGIAADLLSLEQKVGDWGQWTETYEFVVGTAPEYVAANLQATSLINLDATFMAFYDLGGKPAWAGGYEYETEAARDFPGLRDPAQMAALLEKANAEPTRPVSGLFLVDGAPYLVAAGAILDSDGNGPSHGTLVIGHAFDAAYQEELSRRTEVPFTTHRRDEGTVVEPGSAPRRIATTADRFVDRLAIADAVGRPVLHLDIVTSRDATNVGFTSIVIAGLWLGGMALVILFIIGYAINILVVAPLQRINAAMAEVAGSADLEKRLGWNRRDEIGALAARFDHMLEQLARARRDLLELTFKLGRSDLATGMFHNLRNAMSPLANQLHRAGAALSPPSDSHVDQALGELAAPEVETARKSRLVEFLKLAVEQMQGRQQSAQEEVAAAMGQVKAIEQILNQQSGADAAAASEALALPFLVREGLSLFGSGQLAGVRVELDPAMDRLPPVRVQRLPMIHVIYNVIANALAAIAAKAGDGQGRIGVRAQTVAGEPFIRLEIVDNGIGVAVTSLTELFRAGYTTKADKKGGEGLHWCANTMAANGGRIWAESAGPEQGLTILIEIPLAAKRPATDLRVEAGAGGDDAG